MTNGYLILTLFIARINLLSCTEKICNFFLSKIVIFSELAYALDICFHIFLRRLVFPEFIVLYTKYDVLTLH